MRRGLLLARKVLLVRALIYMMVVQCLGAICGVGLVKAFQKRYYKKYAGHDLGIEFNGWSREDEISCKGE
ncbi:hypothetical protein VNO77_42656 [Canavalia gladiata]|uniref:Uncharacterized protein n=1 Tax=Canavalia gladiata TaxID=3824 RepID=A0AAN9JUX5_CANGL